MLRTVDDVKAQRRRERQARARRIGRHAGAGFLLLGCVSWVLPATVALVLWTVAFIVAAVVFFRAFA
jgi:hypothetical protein